MKKQLFKEVEEKLSAYMKTEKYQDLLVKYIEKAVAYSDRGEMTIYVNPTDADKKAYLEEKTGFTLSISKEDFIGGIRAVNPERNILVDYAFRRAGERISEVRIWRRYGQWTLNILEKYMELTALSFI